MNGDFGSYLLSFWVFKVFHLFMFTQRALQVWVQDRDFTTTINAISHWNMTMFR